MYNTAVKFRWHAWNIEHIAMHGISVPEAQFIVEHPRRPYPEMIGDGKRYIAGQTPDGTYAQVIYLLDPDGTVFVIHARLLNDSEKRKYRTRIK